MNTLEPEHQLPTIEEQSSEEVVSTPGRSVSLECKCSGYPEPKAIWLKNDVELVSSDNFKISSKNNVHTLSIKSLTVEDDAEYVCQVNNKEGSAEAIFSIIVEEEKTKPTFVERLEELEIGEGEPADFSVLVESNPSSDVSECIFLISFFLCTSILQLSVPYVVFVRVGKCVSNKCFW